MSPWVGEPKNVAGLGHDRMLLYIIILQLHE